MRRLLREDFQTGGVQLLGGLFHQKVQRGLEYLHTTVLIRFDGEAVIRLTLKDFLTELALGQ